MGLRYLEVPVDNLMRRVDLSPPVERFDFADLAIFYKLMNGITDCSALLASANLRTPEVDFFFNNLRTFKSEVKTSL
ncbi:hypothetical protein J6590_023173 [Homalodisca vitripennis]|nr:hypothetical protein J6590_023173 [Homalodisca vitripennis]